MLLNYLALEVGLALPRRPDWSLVYRIHHRSGIFGLMGGLRGVSDYYSVGEGKKDAQQTSFPTARNRGQRPGPKPKAWGGGDGHREN
jgi:hypothetical protein